MTRGPPVGGLWQLRTKQPFAGYCMNVGKGKCFLVQVAYVQCHVCAKLTFVSMAAIKDTIIYLQATLLKSFRAKLWTCLLQNRTLHFPRMKVDKALGC